MCVQIRQDWDLAADTHQAGYGIIYPLVVHDEHPDLHEYDRAVGLDEIVTGESNEPVDAASVARKKKHLKRVKQEEDDDDERVGPEPNPGINRLHAHLKKKKQRRS